MHPVQDRDHSECVQRLALWRLVCGYRWTSQMDVPAAVLLFIYFFWGGGGNFLSPINLTFPRPIASFVERGRRGLVSSGGMPHRGCTAAE